MLFASLSKLARNTRCWQQHSTRVNHLYIFQSLWPYMSCPNNPVIKNPHNSSVHVSKRDRKNIISVVLIDWLDCQVNGLPFNRVQSQNCPRHWQCDACAFMPAQLSTVPARKYWPESTKLPKGQPILSCERNDEAKEQQYVWRTMPLCCFLWALQ